ncbi:IS110 family transposase [Streptomyces sp. NPDC059340]|uniref:IS110 family transposase n=1 Tax=Streptomyces sp. NPDC059340 TaxID=3346806 RepID=UPI0036A5EAF3
MSEYEGHQYVGVDLHRRRSVIVRQREDGIQLSAVCILNDPVALGLQIEQAGCHPDVVLEATYGWYWAADVLQAAGARVHLAHPLGVKGFAYRRVKNDVRDAADLADLLRRGRLPEAWIAPPPVRELRELVRYRAKLVALRSGLKSQVHAVLAKVGILVAASDLFGIDGRARLEKTALAGPYAQRVTSLLKLIDELDTEEALFNTRIAERLQGHAGYRAIQQLPGIGTILAAILVAEIGDIHRFASPDRLCSWAGLTPRHYESDTVVRRGTSPSRAASWCAGRWWRRSSARPPSRSPRTGPGSKPAAAETSPRSPRHASCSRWSTTGCGTEKSASWPARPHEHIGRGRRAVGQLSDPLHGAVAVLIDPACRMSHRSMGPRTAKE